MKRALILLSFIFLCFIAHSQNLNGLQARQIRDYMKTNQTDMNYNKVVNNKFKYLKYTDNSENQTILFFMSRDSVCKGIRIVFDPGLKPKKEKELNSLYKKVGENQWSDNKNGKNYLINMKEEKYSFVISIEAEN